MNEENDQESLLEIFQKRMEHRLEEKFKEEQRQVKEAIDIQFQQQSTITIENSKALQQIQVMLNKLFAGDANMGAGTDNSTNLDEENEKPSEEEQLEVKAKLAQESIGNYDFDRSYETLINPFTRNKKELQQFASQAYRTYQQHVQAGANITELFLDDFKY